MGVKTPGAYVAIVSIRVIVEALGIIVRAGAVIVLVRVTVGAGRVMVVVCIKVDVFVTGG